MPSDSPHASPTTAVIGSTGFLGPYILASLLRNHVQSKIFCLNRSVDSAERTLSSLERIYDINPSIRARLQFYVANITKPNFGLEPLQAKLLTSEVEVVIFNAWSPNWSLPLSSFQPFLTAICNAVDFCVESCKRPRMVFISSICAVGEWPREHPTKPLIPEDIAWDATSAMAHGYGKSKCIAEQLLARANAIFGLRVAIVRSGQIGGPLSRTTAYKAWPIQGWLYSVIKTSNKIGYWPTHVQPLDWIFVDVLAEGIATITRTKSMIKDLQVYNMTHPEPAQWDLLHSTLQERCGLRAHRIGLPEWLDKLEPGSLKLYDFLRAAGKGREYNMAFEKTNALELLSAVTPITADQLETWLRGWNLNLDGVKPRI